MAVMGSQAHILRSPWLLSPSLRFLTFSSIQHHRILLSFSLGHFDSGFKNLYQRTHRNSSPHLTNCRKPFLKVHVSQRHLHILSPVTHTTRPNPNSVIDGKPTRLLSTCVTWPVFFSLMGRQEVEEDRQHNVMFLLSDIIECFQERQNSFLLATWRVYFQQQEGSGELDTHSSRANLHVPLDQLQELAARLDFDIWTFEFCVLRLSPGILYLPSDAESDV